MIQALR
jgi:Ran GTPase-activating protein (RanGAP) involved in mRNA processing and transport